jgi:hypothetical protein
MREIKVTVPTAATVSAPVILDQYIAPFQVSYVKTGSGTVQVSQTDPYPVVNQDFVTATFTWVTAPDLTPNADGFLGQPFRAIRLSGATAGDTLTVVQAGVK